MQDTGKGIPETQLENIFERFYRVDPNRTRAEGGTGLGLAITKSIVEKHNGKIWVDSKFKGGGSTFSVPLPAAQNGHILDL